mgnify:CR=1 FL=1
MLNVLNRRLIMFDISWLLHLASLFPMEGMEMRFMQYALIALILLAPMTAALGVQVVHYRMAFFADAVGHSAFAGVAIGLTYGKTLGEACEIGSMLAASVIVTTDSVCPRFLPRELGLDMDVED